MRLRSKQLADEIESLETQRSKLSEQLDTLVVKFRPHMASAAETWIRQEVSRQIRDRAEDIEKMGIKRVRALKSKVEALINSLPQIVLNETSEKNNWPHNQPQQENEYEHVKSEPIHKAFRNVVSHIANVWNEFGLLRDPRGYGQTWERVGTNKFRYNMNPGFDVLQCDILDQYSDRLNLYHELVSQVEAKEKERSKAKAKEIWESA